MPVPGHPVTPVRPPALPEIGPISGPIVRGGFRTIARELWGWYDLFRLAQAFNPFATPLPGFGWDLSGWTQVCQVGYPGAPYDQNDRHWLFGNSSSVSNTCGLGGQSFGTAFDNAPTTSSKNVVYGYRNAVLFPPTNRFFIYEKWSRPANGPAPLPLVGRNPQYLPNPMLPQWPSDLPTPEIWQVPGGQPAPTPMPTPYPIVPMLPSFEPMPGGQWLQRGNGLGLIELGESHDLSNPSANPSSRPMPRPNPNPQPRRPRERERKTRAGSAATHALLRVVNMITESTDKLSALYNALPRAVRRQVWRDSHGFVTPRQKLEALWRYWRQISVEEAFRQLVREEVTDWIYGAGGNRAGRHWGEITRSPFGFQTGRSDDAFGDALYDWYEEQTGHPPSGPGDLFDFLWPPSASGD